jgi:hypothetical protein
MATNRTAVMGRANSPVPFAVAVVTIGLALAGCESGSTLLGGANQPVTAVAEPAAKTKTVSVAIAPVLGVPEATSRQLVAGLGGGLDKTKVTLVTAPGAPSDYTLRGYATASKDKTAAAGKLAYFFDVMDGSGKKINRIAGEEVLAAPATGKDIWLSVTPSSSRYPAKRQRPLRLRSRLAVQPPRQVRPSRRRRPPLRRPPPVSAQSRQPHSRQTWLLQPPRSAARPARPPAASTSQPARQLLYPA